MDKKIIVKLNTFNLSGDGKLFLVTDSSVTDVKLTVGLKNESDRASFSFSSKKEDGYVGDFRVENAKLWTVNEPNLYEYCVSCKCDGEETEIKGTFAFRTITKDEKNIYLNGDPVFIRGYIRGATAHEHPNLCGISEADYYRKNILNAKSFGYNFIRFHSVVPNETFMNVADELGILVHIELRMPYAEGYNNLEEMVSSVDTFANENYIEGIIDNYFNHPSLAVYCLGNELKNSGDEMIKLGRFIKGKDPSRFFLDTSAWGKNNRENVDIDVQHMGYYFPFGKHGDMFDDTENLLVCGSASGGESIKYFENSSVSRTPFFKVPLIAHEVCHYTALRDVYHLKERFNYYGAKEPWWIDEEIKMIETKGYKEEYPEMYLASKHFQQECWKTAYEKMRGSSLLSGFHFLQLADTERYENSNGILDCFDDPCYVDKDEFKAFNGDKVLLIDFNRRVFKEGENLVLPVKFSSYGSPNVGFGKFEYSLITKEGKVLLQGDMEQINLERTGLYEICRLKITLPNLEISTKCTLKVAIYDENGLITSNKWNIWVYKKEQEITYQQFTNYESGDVFITDDIEKAFNLLEKGKKVCLVYRNAWTRHLLDKKMANPKYALKATWNRFKPVIWDRGTNYGGICNEELFNKYGFATDRLYDFNYSVITEDCDKVSLDDFPCKVKSHLFGIDKSVRDRFDAYANSLNIPDFQYEYTMRRFSYLFELKVDKGELLVCCFNMTGLDENEPSTVAMAKFIMSYMSSKNFAPENVMKLSDLKEYMKGCAKKPVKERMMTQFWELDDTPVESKQYWIDSRAYITTDEE